MVYTYNKESARKYYLANAEKIKAGSREFYHKNKERILAKNKEKYWSDPEIRIIKRGYYVAIREKIKYRRHLHKSLPVEEVLKQVGYLN